MKQSVNAFKHLYLLEIVNVLKWALSVLQDVLFIELQWAF